MYQNARGLLNYLGLNGARQNWDRLLTTHMTDIVAMAEHSVMLANSDRLDAISRVLVEKIKSVMGALV